MSYTIEFKNGTFKEFDTLAGADLQEALLVGAILEGENLRETD